MLPALGRAPPRYALLLGAVLLLFAASRHLPSASTTSHSAIAQSVGFGAIDRGDDGDKSVGDRPQSALAEAAVRDSVHQTLSRQGARVAALRAELRSLQTLVGVDPHAGNRAPPPAGGAAGDDNDGDDEDPFAALTADMTGGVRRDPFAGAAQPRANAAGDAYRRDAAAGPCAPSPLAASGTPPPYLGAKGGRLPPSKATLDQRQCARRPGLMLLPPVRVCVCECMLTNAIALQSLNMTNIYRTSLRTSPPRPPPAPTPRERARRI